MKSNNPQQQTGQRTAQNTEQYNSRQYNRGTSGTHHHHQDTVDAAPHHGSAHRSKSTAGHSSHHHHSSNAHGHRSHSQAKAASQQQSSQIPSQSVRESTGGATATTSASQPKARQSGSSGNTNAVGHYILGKALGEGTFGKVKLGTHVLTGEKVAVKVLEKSKIKDKKDVERISREIKILKQLHHPNVVQIYEIIETDKDLYLVMEFASGGELFEIIVKNQKLKEVTASKHLQELVAGVHYIHQLGICHRDLKPENLLLDYDGQLKIVDFGLSNMYEKRATLKTACGSPCYAAPEMIAGNRYHGLKSDIWSCGVVLYAMLCGYLPFEDQKTSNLYKKIMNADYSLPKFLSSEAKDILSKIFVTDPSKRIDIEGLKQHPWYRLYQPENQNFNHHNMARTVNEKLLLKMEASLGFSTESVKRAVENNKHNHLSATYYLLLKKYAQASYKTSQATRNSQVQARVDTRNTDYISVSSNGNSKRIGASKNNNPQNNNSDSKNITSSKASSNHANNERSSERSSPAKGTKKTGTNYIRNSLQQPNINKAIENDRIKAPVQDQLVLKNHRREQSANATAGRHNRNGDWGNDVGDERRTESHERAAATDDYEIVVSKVTRQPPVEEKRTAAADNGYVNQNLRAHFASPSPDVADRGRYASTSGRMSDGMQNNNDQKATSMPMEVNISNMKQAYSQVTTPSQAQTRATSLPKSSLPKAATYTHATISSSQRSAEKQKFIQKQQERQASQSATQASSTHRKTKSSVHDIHKQNTMVSNKGSSAADNSLIERSSGKFSQTQRIPSYSKSSGQPSRQQNIPLNNSGGGHQRERNHATTSGDSNHPGASSSNNQTAKVSELLGSLNKMTQQKTYFDQISGKQQTGFSASYANQQLSGNTAVMIPSKQNSEDAAGIEGNNVAQADPVVNVNKNSNGSGIFQSLNSMRPIIQDANSQNLLKRLESGNSDNQLKQNFASRQSKRRDEQTTNVNQSKSKQSIDPRQQNSRLSYVSQNNQQHLGNHSHYLTNSNGNVQPGQSKTPVSNGFQTMDTMGDASSHELKIPINPDTERGVSKQIFYGTQRMSANYGQKKHVINEDVMQRYSNDHHHQIQKKQKQGSGMDLSRTQAITSGSNQQQAHLLSSQNDRTSSNANNMTKSVTHRTDSSTRQALKTVVIMSQPTTTKHQRHQTSVGVSKLQKPASSTHDTQRQQQQYSTTNQRQSHSSALHNTKAQVVPIESQTTYTIPTQHIQQNQQQQQQQQPHSQSQYQAQVSALNYVQQQQQQQQAQKLSQQKFQSLKVSSTTAVKVQHPHTKTNSIDQSQSNNTGATTTTVAQSKINYAQTAKSSTTSAKTRSHSVSGAGGGSQSYTPASHRKGPQFNNNGGAVTTLTAQYKSGTAGNRESQHHHQRRSSQPPTSTQQPLSKPHTQQQQPAPKQQRSSSTSNYQSAFLVKSLDGRDQHQRARQKPTNRDVNSSFTHQYNPGPLPQTSSQTPTSLLQASQNRQFQSITHAPNNQSLMMGQMDNSTTIFDQSFNGTASQHHQAVQQSQQQQQPQATRSYQSQNSRKQQSAPFGQAGNHNDRQHQHQLNTSNNRDLQVASINELLQVAEQLKHSHNKSAFNSICHQGTTSQEQITRQATQHHRQTNNFIDDSAMSGTKLMNTMQIGSMTNNAQLIAQPQPSIVVKQQQQSLGNAMKSITEGLMQKQHYNASQQASQHQSYLTELLAKQQQQQHQQHIYQHQAVQPQQQQQQHQHQQQHLSGNTILTNADRYSSKLGKSQHDSYSPNNNLVARAKSTNAAALSLDPSHLMQQQQQQQQATANYLLLNQYTSSALQSPPGTQQQIYSSQQQQQPTQQQHHQHHHHQGHHQHHPQLQLTAVSFNNQQQQQQPQQYVVQQKPGSVPAPQQSQQLSQQQQMMMNFYPQQHQSQY